MKKPMKTARILLLASSLFVAQGLQSLSAQVIDVKFESPSDMSGFVQNRSNGGTGNSSLVQAAGTGVGNPASGGLIFSPSGTGADITDINTTAFAFSPTLTQLNYAIDLQKAAYTSSSTLLAAIGFASATNQTFATTGTGADQVQFRLQETANNTLRLQLVNRTSDGGSSLDNLGSSFTVANSNTDWFHMSFSLTLTNDELSEFSYTVSIYNIGTQGIDTPSLLQSASGTFINAGLATDSSIYAGLRFTQVGISAGDNLYVAAIPEPASLVLFGVGFAGLIIWRKCRKEV